MKQIAIVVASFAALAMFGCSSSSSSGSSVSKEDQIACTFANPLVGDLCMYVEAQGAAQQSCEELAEENEPIGSLKSQGSSCPRGSQGNCVVFDELDRLGNKQLFSLYYYEPEGKVFCNMIERMLDSLKNDLDDEIDDDPSEDQIACTYTHPIIGGICLQMEDPVMKKEGCPTGEEETEGLGTFKSQGVSCKKGKGSCVIEEIDEETGKLEQGKLFYYETAGALLCEVLTDGTLGSFEGVASLAKTAARLR